LSNVTSIKSLKYPNFEHHIK